MREIVKPPITRRTLPVSTGSRPRASASRYHPIRSCSVRIIRPGAPLPACVTLTGIQSCTASSAPPNPEGNIARSCLPQPLALDRSVPQGHLICNRCVQRSFPTSLGIYRKPTTLSDLKQRDRESLGTNSPGTQVETSRFPSFAASRVRRRYRPPTTSRIRHPTPVHPTPLRGPFRSTGHRGRQVVQPRERLWVRRTFRWLR